MQQLIFIALLLVNSTILFAQTKYKFEELSKYQQKIIKKEHEKAETIVPLSFTGIISSGINQQQTELNRYMYSFQSRFGAQIISRIDDNDEMIQKVVKKSNIDSKPREVLTISALKDDITYFYDDFYSDNSYSSISGETVEKAVREFLEKFKKDTGSLKMDRLVITHSHPVYELLVVNKDGTGSIERKYLSLGDMNNAREVSVKYMLGTPVLIQAIMANNYTYIAVFLSGQNIL